jgi:hypothetical protein
MPASRVPRLSPRSVRRYSDNQALPLPASRTVSPEANRMPTRMLTAVNNP